MNLRIVGRRLYNIVRFGQLNVTDDAGRVLTGQVKLSYLETFASLPVVQHFGLTSNPPSGSDAVIVSPSGDPSKGVVIGTNHQGSRPTGNLAGETVLYNAFSIKISLTAAGIVIDGGGLPIVINNAPTVTQNGDLHVTGAVIGGFGTGDQVGLNSHSHIAPSGGGATTAPSAGT